MRHLLSLSAALLLALTVASGCATTDAEKKKEAQQDKKDAKLDAAAAALQAEYNALALKNVCPKGNESLQGDWTFAGRSKMPQFKDDLDIKGTRFVEKMSGLLDGKPIEATLTGEIRCMFKNRVLIMVDKVDPEGAFDNQSGTSYPCDVLTPMSKKDANTVMLMCYFDWDIRPGAGRQFVYKLRNPPPTP